MCLFPYTQGGLVWDDHILLSEGLWRNESIASIWLQSVQGGEIATQYYRPIPMTIFALVHSVWLHVITLLVHLGSAWLLCDWLRTRFENTAIIYTGALLFAFAPNPNRSVGVGELLTRYFWSYILVCGLSGVLSINVHPL